jgi:hypothetical protein
MDKQLIKHKQTTNDLRNNFWSAPNDALLDRETTAAGVVRSIGWMEIKAVKGGGIPYLKCGRRCLYRKSDALAWLEANSKRVHSTSEYDAAAQGVQGE